MFDHVVGESTVPMFSEVCVSCILVIFVCPGDLRVTALPHKRVDGRENESDKQGEIERESKVPQTGPSINEDVISGELENIRSLRAKRFPRRDGAHAF